MSDTEINEIEPITRNVLQKNKIMGINKRNWIEAFIFSILGLSIVRHINFVHDIKNLISVITVTVLFIFGIRGIMGRSVTQIIIAELKFRKRRRKLHLRSPEYARNKNAEQATSYEEQSIAEQVLFKLKKHVNQFINTYSESSSSEYTKKNTGKQQ